MKIVGTRIADGIYRTSNYDVFKFGNNRPISQKNVESKKTSIKEFGQLTPIEVTSDYFIKEGQHRFLALKELGIPVIYRFALSDTFNISEIAEMNSSVTKWDMYSYISVIAESGNESYKLIKVLWDEFPDVGWGVLSLAISNSGRGVDVKSGSIKLTETEYERARDIISQARELYALISSSKYSGKIYLRAFVNLIKFNLYDYDKLYDALDRRSKYLWQDGDKPTTMISAIQRIEGMYNYNIASAKRRYITSDYKRIASSQGARAVNEKAVSV